MAIPNRGRRPLHMAATDGNVEFVRVLLQRDHAEPNVTDKMGRTALLAVCEQRHPCVEVVRLLLDASADPTMTYRDGLTPLHLVAHNGHIELVDMVFLRAPSTLNQLAVTLGTPLCLACSEGNESTVSKLLSLGAMEPMPPRDRSECPLVVAVTNGRIRVVRILIKERAMIAVGGNVAMSMGLHAAIECRQVLMLRLLLSVGGEERRSWWTNIIINGMTLVHLGARYCYPAAINVLLKAGADETAHDCQGCTPRDVIGLSPHEMDPHQMDPTEEVAVRRMLGQGPAYRARSLAWPLDEQAGVSDTGDLDGDSATGAIVSSVPATRTAPIVDVRVFRPQQNRSGKFFVKLLGRYCAKD